MKIFVVEEEDKGTRLDQYLVKQLDLTRTRVQNLIKENNIKVNNEKTKVAYKIEPNDSVRVYIPEVVEKDIEAEDIKLDIVYQDGDIAIINKYSGMVVHPAHGHYSGTLVNAILFQIKDLSGINGEMRPGIVHRLDKDTSGLIIVAKNDKAHTKLTEMFKNKEIKKTYLAIVKGKVSKETGRIETNIGRDEKDRKKMSVSRDEKKGKLAITTYKVIDSNERYSLLDVNIETGRTHQIRVHMKHIGYPILGDIVYGRPDNKIMRQMLHAYKLEFKHPITSEEMVLEAQLPKDFVEALGYAQLQY
ncbi:MAG: RluA family pseudouridine synthase [Leptotrichiaceae bacterium]|jgi:23S rRNA pseudouridine1911/1915/1917 synthase|nr:RluA family pseudouridine synthase [Leptotrichiaceae bacterium]MBP9876232.1 RluA family pseudouridine synthase [Leptotrichiaceae bacterium]